MPTTTPDDIRAIIDTDLDDSMLQVFADAAACITGAAANCMDAKGITADCQDTATTWLAAHLLLVSGLNGDKGKTKKRVTFENYTVEFLTSSFSAVGMLGTDKGQAANTLSGGCLQEQDKRNAGICFA